MPAFLYIFSCLTTPLLTEKFPKRLIIAVGFHMIAGSMFMIGQDGTRMKTNAVHMILGGLFFLGLSGGMIATPMTPEW